MSTVEYIRSIRLKKKPPYCSKMETFRGGSYVYGRFFQVASYFTRCFVWQGWQDTDGVH